MDDEKLLPSPSSQQLALQKILNDSDRIVGPYFL